MNLLELDGEEIEQTLRFIDEACECMGKMARKQAEQLFAASRKACIEEVGEKNAKCLCWWERTMDLWEKHPDAEKPLWIRLSDRAVTYDELAATLGAGHNPSDGFLCDASSCDCPWYDGEGQPRSSEEVERRLGE